jgi:hypothetical protein
MFLLDTNVKTQITLRCGKCYKQTAAAEACCEFCGFEIRPAEPKSFVARIKRALGIEISSEIVTIDLEDDRAFFNAREIDSLLDLEKLTVLDLEDVPDYDSIFYSSKRIRKPLNRSNQSR